MTTQMFVVGLVMFLLSGMLIDFAGEIRTNGLPFYAWQRALSTFLKLCGCILFAVYVWPVYIEWYRACERFFEVPK
jgi:hypothetical protein